MARIRTIKPEFWTDEKLSELPEATHLLAAALINYADDEGYFNANEKLVAAGCSPLREPSVSIPESFRRLQSIGYLAFARGKDGRIFGAIVNFAKHQKVSHPTPSKIKTSVEFGNPPEIFWNPPEVLRPELNGIELNGIDLGASDDAQKIGDGSESKPKRKRFKPPTVEEVRTYCLARGNNVDAEMFVAHYAANGWKRGTTKIKSWRKCVQTWEIKMQRDAKSTGKAQPVCTVPTDEELAEYTP